MDKFLKKNAKVNPILSWCHLQDIEWQVNTGQDKPHFWRSVKEDSGGPIPIYHKDIPDWFPEHARLVGSSGWNPVDQISIWCGIDVDTTDHTGGIDQATLDEIVAKCSKLSYVQVQRSKGGKGIHLFGRFNPDDRPFAEFRSDHSSNCERFARLIERDTGLKLIGGDADCFGHILWLWSSERGKDSFKLLSEASGFIPELPLAQPPARKTFDGESDAPAEAPRELIAALNAIGCAAIWQSDQRCLHTHTFGLAEVHRQKNLPGRFETISAGTNLAQPNCFYWPHSDWSGRVVRFGRGTKETSLWEHREWTSCRFGYPLDLPTACRLHGGIPTEDGGWVLPLDKAADAVEEVTGKRPIVCDNRQATVSAVDAGIVIDVDKQRGEDCPEGFRKHRSKWRQFIPCESVEKTSLKGKVFCGVRHGSASEWFTHLDGQLIARSKDDCRSALCDIADPKVVSQAINRAARKVVPIVRVPFQPSIHNGKLNPDAPQLIIKPSPGDFPTWMDVCRHTGESLDEALSTGWGAEHGVDGTTYIMAWIANALREPTSRLPMLSMVGKQFAAKNTIVDAIKILVPGGVYKIAKQLRSDDKFDASLEGMPFVFADEVNLASEKIFTYVKPWITDPEVTVRAMYRQPYAITNFTHWFQATNRIDYIPVFDDVSRITVLQLKQIPADQRIPRETLMAKLRAEAPAFLHHLFNMSLPPGDSRTALPMIHTDVKQIARELTDDPLNRAVERFLGECCREGESVSLKDFTERLSEWSGTPFKQCAVQAALVNQEIGIKLRKGYPFVIGWEVTA